MTLCQLQTYSMTWSVTLGPFNGLTVFMSLLLETKFETYIVGILIHWFDIIPFLDYASSISFLSPSFCIRLYDTFYWPGHSPHFKVSGEQKTVLCNVPHRGTDQYVFVDVHVHIGRKKERGSEHAMNGVFYPMEVKPYNKDSKKQTI